MKLSVCVPVYNTSRYLRKCLDSIINQTYQKLEIILVDDGSTDDSGAICDYYAAADKRIRVIHTPNGGQSHARNIGLDNARGEFIVFVDSDDYLTNNRFFELGIERLKEHRDVDICVFSWERRSRKGKMIGRHICADIRWNNPYEYFCNYEPVKGKTAECYYVPVWGKIYRRRLFDAVIFPEGKVFEDVAINADILLKAKGVMLSSEVVYAYCENQAGTMANLDSSKKIDAISSNLYVLNKAIEAFPDRTLPGKYFNTIFYETCVIGYLSNIEIGDSLTHDMGRTFKLIHDKNSIPAIIKWLIMLCGVRIARQIYISLMKIKNRGFSKN